MPKGLGRGITSILLILNSEYTGSFWAGEELTIAITSIWLDTRTILLNNNGYLYNKYTHYIYIYIFYRILDYPYNRGNIAAKTIFNFHLITCF